MTQAQPEPPRYRYPPAIWRKALRIADRPGETTLSARFQIAAILQLCGRDFVHQMLEQTREVEALGAEQQALVVEGMCVYDPALEGLAVYALKVSTTRLKKKKSHRT